MCNQLKKVKNCCKKLCQQNVNDVFVFTHNSLRWVRAPNPECRIKKNNGAYFVEFPDPRNGAP